jgi:hypothetical protein
MSPKIFTHFMGYARELTLCMLAFSSHEGVVFLDLLPSPHLVMSFLFPCLGSTDALCPRLGDPVSLPPKWRPYSQGPRTLPLPGSGTGILSLCCFVPCALLIVVILSWHVLCLDRFMMGGFVRALLHLTLLFIRSLTG